MDDGSSVGIVQYTHKKDDVRTVKLAVDNLGEDNPAPWVQHRRNLQLLANTDSESAEGLGLTSKKIASLKFAYCLTGAKELVEDVLKNLRVSQELERLVKTFKKAKKAFADRVRKTPVTLKASLNSDRIELKMQDAALQKVTKNAFAALIHSMQSLQKHIFENSKEAKTNSVLRENKAITSKKINVMPRVAVNKIASLHAQLLVENILKEFIVAVRDASLTRATMGKTQGDFAPKLPKKLKLLESMKVMSEVRNMSLQEYVKMLDTTFTITTATEHPTGAAAVKKDDAMQEYRGMTSSAGVGPETYRSSITSPVDSFTSQQSEDWYSFVEE
jgi:hypothetical protein